MLWRPHLNMGLKVARQALRRTPVGPVTLVGIKVDLQGSDLLTAWHTLGFGAGGMDAGVLVSSATFSRLG